MSIKEALARAAAAVAAVFAAFSGFLLNIQPPEQALSGFTVGFASTVSALIFLLISVFTSKTMGKWHRRLFVLLALLLILGVILSGMRYQSKFVALTFDLPSNHGTEKLIMGKQLTPEAAKYLEKNRKSIPELVLDFGGKDSRELVWTRSSLDQAKIELNDAYLALAVLIAAAVFCLVEALRAKPQMQGRTAGAGG